MFNYNIELFAHEQCLHFLRARKKGKDKKRKKKNTGYIVKKIVAVRWNRKGFDPTKSDFILQRERKKEFRDIFFLTWNFWIFVFFSFCHAWPKIGDDCWKKKKKKKKKKGSPKFPRWKKIFSKNKKKYFLQNMN